MKKKKLITGGLPELDTFEQVVKETQRIKVRTETRSYGKVVTIIEGIDEALDPKSILKELKRRLGCGGTYDKDSKAIVLQGDHRNKIKKLLVDLGFSESSISIE